MTNRAGILLLFAAFGLVAHMVFALTWLQAALVSATVSVFFRLLARSEERLGRVEACLGTEIEDEETRKV